MPVSYPLELPIESISELVRLVRQGQISTQAPVIAWHAWNVQGFVQKVLIGAPSRDPLVAWSVAEPDAEPRVVGESVSIGVEPMTMYDDATACQQLERFASEPAAFDPNREDLSNGETPMMGVSIPAKIALRMLARWLADLLVKRLLAH